MLVYCTRCILQGWIRADEESRGLKVVVQMNAKAMGAEAKNNKKVKDLKQLSGEPLRVCVA